VVGASKNLSLLFVEFSGVLPVLSEATVLFQTNKQDLKQEAFFVQVKLLYAILFLWCYLIFSDVHTKNLFDLLSFICFACVNARVVDDDEDDDNDNNQETKDDTEI
jgi:hypothetical protein